MKTLIVGAGPAGCLCAEEAASLGADVTVWEEHPRAGEPVNCTGLVSKSGLDKLDVDYKDAIKNECKGARLFSPGGQMVEVKRKATQAIVLDRAAFDRTCAEAAEAAGAKIVFSKHWAGERSDILVGADGPMSAVAKQEHVTRAFFHTYQVVAELERDEDFVELYLTQHAPGFFAWIVPEGDGQCRVGIGLDQKLAPGRNPQLALARFLTEHHIKLEFESESSALIPKYDGEDTVFGNVALVGDAAGQVKSTTGGGLAIGGYCGRICGQVIGRELPLVEYDRLWRKDCEADLKLHLRIRNWANRLSPADLDSLFAAGLRDGIAEIIEQHGDMEQPGRLVTAIMKKPRLLLELAKKGF